MRRGSLVGPLLIILIGAWLLVSSLRPDLLLWDLATQFWPFVLIGWGLLRLLEIMVWAAKGRPLPGAGISGGEWSVIVVLSLLGSGVTTVRNHSHNWGMFTSNRVEIFGSPYDFTVAEQTAPAPKVSKIIVENLRGSIRIAGVPAQEVKVNGRKTIRAIQDTEANNADKQTPVEIATQGDQMVIRTNQDRITNDDRIRVTTDIEISVPKTANIEVRGRSGDIDISEVAGTVDISSDSATVRLQNVGGNARLDVRKSDMVRAGGLNGNLEVQSGRGRDIEIDGVAGEVTVNGSFSGDLQFRNCSKPVRFQSQHTDLRVEKLPGQIHMDLGSLNGSDIVGPIRLTSDRTRDVQLEQFTQAAELKLDRGDVTLRPMTAQVPRIDASTRSGQIEIVLPESAKFSLKASTERGDLNNEFGPALQTKYENDRHPESGGAIVGSIGDGPAVTVSTGRGSVTVRKDSGVAPKAQKTARSERVHVDAGGVKVEVEKH